MANSKVLHPSNRSGQAVTEYLLLLLIILGIASIIRVGLRKYRVPDLLLQPIQKNFYYTYRYGHVEARGPDDGGFKHHPRYIGGGNFRLFMNPGRKGR